MATEADLRIRIDADDQAARTVKNLGRNMKELGGLPLSAGRGLMNVLGQIGLASLGVQAVTGAVKGLGSALGIGLVSEMEIVRAQLLAFTKDAGVTEKILEDVRKEAALTPFAFGEMAKAAVALQPVSKQTNIDLMELVKTAEILAASNPAEGLAGAAFSIREAFSGDFVSIVERFNLPRSTLNRLKAEGVPALEAITIAMNELGLDSQVVANLAGTLSGRWGKLQDTFDEVRRRAAGPLFDLLSTGVDEVGTALDVNIDAVLKWADAFGQGLANAVTTVFRLGAGVKEMFSGGLFVKVFDSLPRAIDLSVRSISGLTQASKGLVQWFGGQGLTGLGGFSAGLQSIFSSETTMKIIGAIAPLQQAFSTLVDSLKGVDLKDIPGKFYDWIGPAVDRFNERWPDMLNAFLDKIEEAVPAIGKKFDLWKANLTGWIADGGPDAERELALWGDRVATFLGSTGEVLGARIAKWSEPLVTWVSLATPKIIEEIETQGQIWRDQLGKVLTDNRMTHMLESLRGHISDFGAVGGAKSFVFDWFYIDVDAIVSEFGVDAREAGASLGAEVRQGFTDALTPKKMKVGGADAAATLVSWILPHLPETKEQLKQWLDGVVQWLEENAGPIADKALEMGEGLYEWIRDAAIPKAKVQLEEWITEVRNWIALNKDRVGEKAAEISGNLVDWVIDVAIPETARQLGLWIAEIETGIKNAQAAVDGKTAGVGGGFDLSTWIKDGTADARQAFKDVIPEWETSAKDLGTKAGDAFVDVFSFIMSGIAAIPKVITAIRDGAQAIADGFHSAFKIAISANEAIGLAVSEFFRAFGVAIGREDNQNKMGDAFNEAINANTDFVMQELKITFDKITVDNQAIGAAIQESVDAESAKRGGRSATDNENIALDVVGQASPALAHRIQIQIGEYEIRDFIVRIIDDYNRGISQQGPGVGGQLAFGVDT